MDGSINFSGTLAGSIADSGGRIQDVQTNTNGDYTSVVDGQGIAKIDLSNYTTNEELESELNNYTTNEELESAVNNINSVLLTKQNVVNYSTEEQNTGRKWIDGKPLYAKTIIHNTPLSNRVWTDIINELNINIKMFDGYIYLDGYPYTQINYYRSTAEYSCGAIVNNEHTFRVYPSIDGATITCIVTIYYTKVTD
jgi:hypothetical protein